ncbi:MAG: hypothetical protein PHX10_04015 [Gallionellaceae bacterium]|nr:hypothetical protein [Gallionellaceae bacterium]
MSEELSPEDQLRLNVLLAQDIKAIRIDESSLLLHALLDEGEEASMPLHPNCRADKYLRLVREALSGHALGSPGGYPIYLSRWTRHGQMESSNLSQLLLIGEPEAVVAVVHSPALTNELAGYAWWAMPTIEHARLMLMREAVAKGRMGPVLAEFLTEHLAFLQEEHLAIMDTVAVLLYSGALTPTQRETIWKRGKRQNSYYVAFLEMCPNDLPGTPGQAFVEASIEILSRPETQEVVSRTLDAIGHYFSVAAGAGQANPEAVRRLAAVSAALANPVFVRSTAIGSLMRRKLEPITEPILADLRLLR